MKNIIFDFGNVLVRYEPEKVYARHFGDEAKAWWFLRHVATPEWMGSIDAGKTLDTAVAELQQQWPDYGEAIALQRSQWNEMLTGEVPGMRELVTDLLQRADTHLYGLTNWSIETFPASRQRFDILQLIEHYVVSGAEGMIKPNPQLFQLLLDRFCLKAEDCVFIDDNEANVRAAIAMGMEGIVFRGADDLRRRLNMERKLEASERQVLEQQGCSADNWDSIAVASDFSAASMLRTHLHGEVYIGSHTEIRDCHIANCHIGNGCRLRSVTWLSNYDIEHHCTIEGVGDMEFNPEGVRLDVMNENGGRSIGLAAAMTVGDAYLWARYRDRQRLMQQFDKWQQHRGHIGSGTTIRNATAIIDGIVGAGCHIEHGVIAERFLLGENVHLEAGLRLNDTVVGDNSTLARGEVGCSLIFPAHEQHHNSSFLIAALVQGQSNVASGATLGSNHNGRTADGELSAGRGFWPGLCVSVKHNCRFASYTLLSKGDYPYELNITLPFALVNNNVAQNRLEVMPAYWWLYNMYALDRNRTKYATRDRRNRRQQHIEYAPLAPDTAEEIIVARDLLRMWTSKAYQENGGSEVIAYGMERGKRKTVILKPGDAYQAYEEMLIYYAMSHLHGTEHYEGPRQQRWVNIGGQLVAGTDTDRLLDDIEQGHIASWNDVHHRLDELWAEYPVQRAQHAYQVLCHLSQKRHLDTTDWKYYQHRYAQIQQMVHDRIVASRQKDANNEYRQTTFLNTAEMVAVMGQ